MSPEAQSSSNRNPSLAAAELLAVDRRVLDGRPSDHRVLVVEDGPTNQKMLELVLRKAGAEFDMVENGEEAVRIVRQRSDEGHSYGVVLMDMRMPVMDGFTATRTLRGDGYSAPIIALTALDESSDRIACFDAGCTDVAAKPINRQHLLQLLEQYNRAEK